MREARTTADVSESFRWWFLPSWLGLDAPCVVLTWTWAISQATGTPLPIRPAVALFLVVWFIYLSDRLIDAARCSDWTAATGRLRFGRDSRPLFVASLCVCVAGICLVWGQGLPWGVIERAAVVALGVCLHGVLFVVPVFLGKKLPGKEFSVGLFFALGAYGCLGLAPRSLPHFLAVALVVAFNCLVIAARDADSDRANDPGGASHWWPTINRDLVWPGLACTLIAAAGSLVAAESVRETAFGFSLAAAFALLTALHRVSRHYSGDAVRALADFALLTPLPIMSAAMWLPVST